MKRKSAVAVSPAPLKWEELRERISEATREKIVAEWGGKKLSVPRVAAGSKLERVIGKSEAALLCGLIPGTARHCAKERAMRSDWKVDVKGLTAVHIPTKFTMYFTIGTGNKQWEQHAVRVTGPDGRVYIGRPFAHTEPERHPTRPATKHELVPEGADAFFHALQGAAPSPFPDYEGSDQ